MANLPPGYQQQRLRHPAIETFEQHWNSLRVGEVAPRRRDFDILDLPGKLWHYITLVEVEREPRRYKYVVFSSANRDAYCEDITGRYMDEIDLGGNLEKYTRQFDEAADSQRPIFEKDSFMRDDGHEYGFEGGCFPLLGEDGHVSHLVLVTAMYRNKTPYTRW